MAAAQASIAKGDYATAVIHLKNLLQQDTSNGQARLLLGEALLESGDLEGAGAQLKLATASGVAPADVAMPLARVAVGKKDYESALKLLAPTAASGPVDPMRQRLIGEAYLGLGRYQEAYDSFASGRTAAPSDLRMLRGLATAALAVKGLDESRRIIDEALAIDRQDAGVWQTLGSIYLRERQYDAAIQSFGEAETIAERRGAVAEQASALAGIAGAQLESGRTKEALATTERLARIAPAAAVTRSLQARAKFSSGDLDAARLLLEQLAAESPEDRQTKLLLGAVNFAQGNLGQADMYLSSVVAADPANVFARGLLAEARLRQDQPDAALEALDASKPQVMEYPELLALAARADAQAGRADSGLELLEAGVRAHPDDPQYQLKLAAGYISSGRLAEANALLEKLPESTSGVWERERLLLLARLRTSLDEGIALGRQLVAKNPKDPVLHTLLGSGLARRHDYRAAIEQYQQAAQLEPRNPAALINLAQVQFFAGEASAAETTLQQALKIDPANAATKTALARASMAQGDVKRGIGMLEDVRKGQPKDVDARILLAQAYLTQKNSKQAVAVAGEAVRAAPDNAAALHMLGVALLVDGDRAAGLENLRIAASKAPASTVYRFDLARAYAATGEMGKAIAEIDAVLKTDPDNRTALLTKATLALQAKDISTAQQIARRIQKADPSSPQPWLLLGEIDMRQNRFAEAGQSFEAAIERGGPRISAIRAYQAHRAAKAEQPVKPIERWVDAHPDDLFMQFLLAQAWQESGDSVRARTAYERYLQHKPDDAIALNNLAWLYADHDSGRALTLARKAIDAKPDSGAILDTYGWLLVRASRASEGVPYLRQAVERMPTPETRYHLAYGLSESGATAEALTLVRQILSESEDSPVRRDAQTLLQRLTVAS